MRWNTRGANFSLKQTTDYPYAGNLRFDLAASTPATFSVFLRIPAWAQGASLTVNGMRDSRKVDAGSFAEIRREWKNGDRIELELPFTTRLEPVDAQHPDVMALSNGPLVLMAMRNGDAKLAPVAHATLLSALQTAPRSHEWIAGSGPTALRMKPFLDIGNEGYTTYLKVVEA